MISLSDMKYATQRIFEEVAEGKSTYLVVSKKCRFPVLLTQGEFIIQPESGNELHKGGTLAGMVQRKLLAENPKMQARRCSECGTNMLWDRTDKREPVCDKCYGRA